MQKTLILMQLYKYIFTLVSLFQGHSAERLERNFFVPACAMPPAAGSGEGAEMTVAGVLLQINLPLPPVTAHTTAAVTEQERPQVSSINIYLDLKGLLLYVYEMQANS